jgi:hypothetical protein
METKNKQTDTHVDAAANANANPQQPMTLKTLSQLYLASMEANELLPEIQDAIVQYATRAANTGNRGFGKDECKSMATYLSRKMKLYMETLIKNGEHADEQVFRRHIIDDEFESDKRTRRIWNPGPVGVPLWVRVGVDKFPGW